MARPTTMSITCSQCGGTMSRETTRMPMWLGAELKLISDVPAHICEVCDIQEFEPKTDAAIRRLVAQGFPDHRIRDRVFVPVFSLDDFGEDAPENGELALPEGAR